MFDPTSRYAQVEILQLAHPDGSATAYADIRILPQQRTLQVLSQVVVGPGERLDVLSARALGDPTQYWRLCDGNDALDPDALLTGPGQRLDVPLPQR